MKTWSICSLVCARVVVGLLRKYRAYVHGGLNQVHVLAYRFYYYYLSELVSGWSVNFLFFINEGQLTVMMDLFTQS